MHAGFSGHAMLLSVAAVRARNANFSLSVKLQMSRLTDNCPLDFTVFVADIGFLDGDFVADIGFLDGDFVGEISNSVGRELALGVWEGEVDG